MYRSICTDATALNATETTEKLIDTITVPSNVSKLVGFRGTALGGAGITTLENITGKWRIRNKSRGEENELLMDSVVVLTSGVAALQPAMRVMDMPVTPGEAIEVYAVLDLAQTVNNTCRAELTFA